MGSEKPAYDVIIIGAGPIGLACGIEAKKAGLSYVILDKGCLVNSLFNYPLNMTFFSTSEKLEIGNIPFVSTNLKPTRSEALEYYRRVAGHYQLTIKLFEAVQKAVKVGQHFVVETIKNTFTCRNLIIATGFYDLPVRLNVPGEELQKVKHYYYDPHYYSLQRVAVIGAANSAVDVALETFRKGAEVSMIIKGSEISERVKYWVRPDIINRIQEGSIKAYYNSEIIKINEDEIIVDTPEGIINIKNDFVLAMTGYLPDFTFLKRLDIGFSEDDSCPVHSPDSMETNIESLFLAGVVCGGTNTHSYFIENSREHATKIIECIKTRIMPFFPKVE